MARVLPPEQASVRDVKVQDVGDLQLAATRRHQAGNNVERARAQEVDTDGDQVALWHDRLLLETDQPIAVKLGNAKTLRIRHAMQKRTGTPRSLVKVARSSGKALAAQNVVAQDRTEAVAAHEVARQTDGVGDSLGAALITVGQVQAELGAVG